MTEENSASLQQAMQLMLDAGDAKQAAHSAIEAAHDGDLATANQKLTQAKEKLNTAHNTQTKMLTSEAQGKKVKLTLLIVHAQDHLMTAITYVDLAGEIIRLYQRLAEDK